MKNLDKEEFRVKLEEINHLVEQKDYKGAMNVVDSIDWRRVKNVRTLCVVGEIYAANKRYEDSKEIFLLAYHRASIGKNILYRLVEVSLKLGQVSEAVEFYQEYREVAPNDNTQYILKYKILKEKKAPLAEAQKLDGLDEFETSKRYMHHYNFPSYSVGETKPSRGPGRREIGHGALAERALVPVLPSEEEFPYAIRTVSETFESNGSTSQASICASTMSLMAAGVPIKKPVAGISCGLVTGDTDDDYIVLTDIQGLEDFFGDMDFKVAGTHDGITAIQMDIKIHGLTRPIVEEAIRRTKEAREYILTEVMEKCIAAPRTSVGEYAPKIIQIQIDPQKIGDVVGQRGKTINTIIERTGVKIDITDEGAVSICGVDQKSMDEAANMVKIIATDFEAGQIFTGKVVSIKEFGAFVEFAPGKEGMVHISKICKERINRVEDVLTLGDKVKVICLGKDKMGRISFSMKDVPEEA